MVIWNPPGKWLLNNESSTDIFNKNTSINKRNEQ